VCGDWRFVLTCLWEGCVCVCVAGVRCGGLRCWRLRVFVIKSLRRLRAFSVVVRFDSGNGRVV